MNNPSPFTAHSDVLQAPVPDDVPGKERLLTELKSRGKGAVSAGHWPDAQALYRKALECCDAPAGQAILYSNLSLVQGKMSLWEDAQTSASEGVKADATYTKAWWRMGQAQAALKAYGAAVTALEEAAKLEPSNKALQKELQKQQQMAKEAEAQAAMAAVQAKTAAKESATTAAAPATKSTTTTTKTTTKVKTDAGDAMQIDVGETTFSKSEHVKGYKIVNGKKTSYFHNELSNEAKLLIGDIAPKKLETAAAPAAAAPASEGTSVWNTAGTWEERNVTAWAKESLETQLTAAAYTLPASSPAPNGLVKCTKANVSGHASVATVRGKKRYIYEFSVELEWSFAHEDNEANGKLNFPDVDGTCMVGEPYEANGFAVDHSDDGQLRPLLEAFVHRQGWRDEIHLAIDGWVGLFKETY
jgi:tetratricopeptide (TPR) repeat protein